MNNTEQEAFALFIAAYALKSEQERARYLDEACRNGPALRQRVEELLEAAGKTTGFLVPEWAEEDDILEGPGTVVGHYKLLEKIGEGAFGVVFMADQVEPMRRRVALKVVKPGMDTKQVIARFEAERQALALMDHPNIAHVLDAGTTESGRPYFVMDLVRGVPITQYCDDNKLTWQERLQLFIPVCEAIQHAHHKGIIHRDIKPSNILVTLHDGEPVPIVIDFGTAKALQRPLTDRTLFTAYGRFIGTPQYISPEQAEMSGLDVDTRADIYSLGVLLYELLTGTTPFEAEQLRSVAFEQMLHMIREEDPPRPSTRISTLGERATDIALHRQVDLKALQRSLRGDLDWIVMKTLEKDRTRRYSSSHELAVDIQRHLADEPVLAGPPGAVYRVRKFVRRHRTGVAFGASIALILVTGLTATLIALNEARHQRDKAVDAREQAALAYDDALTAEAKAEKLRLLSRFASLEGRLGYWTNVLERRLTQIAAAEDTRASFWYWYEAHATALVTGQKDVAHELCRGMLSRFGNSRAKNVLLHMPTSILISPDQSYGFENAVKMNELVMEEGLADIWNAGVPAMAEYRLGHYESAAKHLEPLRKISPNYIGCPMGYFYAMTLHKLGNTNAAERVLKDTNERTAAILLTGDLGESWQQWCLTLVLRAETERLILGREISPPVTVHSLAAAYQSYDQLNTLLKKGYALAREGKWNESAAAYAAALNHSEFDWKVHQYAGFNEGSPAIEMGIAFAWANDRENHERLCRLILDAELKDSEDPAVDIASNFAMLCFLNGGILPADLQERALMASRFAVANADKSAYPLSLYMEGGVAEYYAGEAERAIALFEKDGTNGGTLLYHAMALKKMGRDTEAEVLLHEAEALHAESFQKKTGEAWWDLEIYKLAIEKARILIDGPTEP